MSKAFESLASLARLVERNLFALIAEHSRALLATTGAALPRRRLAELRAMYTADPDPTGDCGLQRLSASAASIQGQLLRLSQRREVAIYLREDELWVADFVDGQGELIDAATWFRFHCGAAATSHTRRRMIRESAIPLSAQLVARIDDLHRGLSSQGTDPVASA